MNKGWREERLWRLLTELSIGLHRSSRLKLLQPQVPVTSFRVTAGTSRKWGFDLLPSGGSFGHFTEMGQIVTDHSNFHSVCLDNLYIRF